MAKSVTFEVKGLDALTRRFDSLTPDVAKEVRKAINVSALKVQKDVVKSVKQRSSGRRYTKKGKTHIASRPNSPPNTDTGNLIKNIIITTGKGLITSGYTALIRSRANYSQMLEEGTGKMIKRPFMGPALRRNRKAIIENIDRAKRKAIR